MKGLQPYPDFVALTYWQTRSLIGSSALKLFGELFAMKASYPAQRHNGSFLVEPQRPAGRFRRIPDIWASRAPDCCRRPASEKLQKSDHLAKTHPGAARIASHLMFYAYRFRQSPGPKEFDFLYSSVDAEPEQLHGSQKLFNERFAWYRSGRF
jgi:hypothetical protein